MVDKKTGMRLCRHCRGSVATEERICEKWPTAIATWMARHGHAIETIPEHNPDCPIVAAGTAPVIVSPADEAEYRLRPEVKPEYQKILLDASVANNTRTIYWFQNRKLIFTGDPRSQVFLTPTRGQHDLICLDDAGRSSQVTIHIF
jgi:penicillin-binding protein 1C